ncbi:cytochrome b [Aestuariicella hydrocarbonica]|uniref:Cytochrome b n=1 Tax=Pseudomaricurvus hydrocarbonicus TaxID=1470433 RepID=A0A9E5MMY9_9GAMM|nr:cytochrome b [Aestuariicella hydrocarbonica]NHO67195.1 cytochrome b [Aestuariicella hydrocarbonica]
MNNRFSLSMRIFHWAMAALLISLLSAGLLMVQSLEPWQITILGLHKSFGVLAAILVIIRLLNRFRNMVPDLPSDLSALQKAIARLSHVLLYGFMLAMPISGYLMQYAAGRPVEVFSLFRLPASLSVDIQTYSIFRELHGWLALFLMALICLHAVAALHHHFVRKDNVLKSML